MSMWEQTEFGSFMFFMILLVFAIFLWRKEESILMRVVGPIVSVLFIYWLVSP